MTRRDLRDRRESDRRMNWLWPLLMLAVVAGVGSFAGLYWSGSE
jgi:fatty acid desaturase